MDEIFGQYSFFDSQPCDNKLPDHAISCKNRNTPICGPGSTAYWTFKLYVNYVRFAVLSFLVFHPLFLDNGSVCRCNHWDNHCPRTFSNTLMYVLITNIEIIFWSSKRLARPKRPWCTGGSSRRFWGGHLCEVTQARVTPKLKTPRIWPTILGGVARNHVQK